MSDADVRAALLLTNRLVQLDVRPFTAREFWQLANRVAPGVLVDQPPEAVAELAGVDAEQAARIRTLLDAATAMSFAQERLADGGVVLVSALDPTFPQALPQRLGSACPPFLLIAGPAKALEAGPIGVVGSRAATETGLAVARQAGVFAAAEGRPVVSGLAQGVDREAMFAALDAGGVAIGIPAEGILRAARSADVRRRVHAGQLCLASPFAPEATFTAGNALARNKLIYALADVTLVVAAADGSGGTWAGASEAIEQRFGTVAAWAGAGGGPGNQALVRRGAAAVDELARLLSVEPPPPPPQQDPLF